MKNIIVLGFGRSGTTWVSDIISKALGGVILFEPFHPSVTEYSKRFSYSTVDGEETSNLLNNYLGKVLNKHHRKMWLMRNHVPFRLEDLSNDFLDTVWKECSPIGFKEIRANFMIDWLRDSLDAKIIYVVRHPCSVVASIKRRSNFWEFGWPDTYDLFLERTIYSDFYRNHDITDNLDLVRNATDPIEKYAIMWSITHAITIPILRELGIPILYYEDLYEDPFSSTRTIMQYLEVKDVHIHPAYIFTPSMTTLKTLHGLYDIEKDVKENKVELFWKDTLSETEVDVIMDIVERFRVRLYDREARPRRLQGENGFLRPMNGFHEVLPIKEWSHPMMPNASRHLI